jgi:hypothetical protein
MAKRVHGEWAPSLPYTHKDFRPYASALGELALAWNDLHVALSFVFSSLLSIGNFAMGNIGMSQAIWQNITSDRMQRNVLAAVAAESDLALTSQKQRDDIKWLCDQATNWEEVRNNALHSPLWGVASAGVNTIGPVIGLGHIRANKLKGKDLLAEYRLCRDSVTVLRNFAMQIDDCLSKRQNGAWPNRPKMPKREVVSKSSATL